MMSEPDAQPARAEIKPDASGNADDDSDSSEHSAAPSHGRSGHGRILPGLRRFFSRPTDREALRENLTDALQSGGNLHEAFTPGERAMLHNILRLREVRVEDVMVPRADVEAIDQTVTLGALLEIFEESGRSRMPVYCDTLDDPRGMVHIRDLLGWLTKQARTRRRASPKTPGNGRKPALNGLELSRVDLTKTLLDSGIIRKVLFVPASMLASDLMQHMQANRTQMALVIDEYGGTDGLASLEDIVEMVVGDIADEHDDEDETMIDKTGDDIWIVDAKTELGDLAEEIGPDFDIRAQSEDVDTLGGLIFAELGRVPARGEVVQALPGFEFHVLDADPRRIKRVRIVRGRAARRVRPLRQEVENTPAPADDETSA